MDKFVLWLRIIRPQTLFASLCPVLVALLVMSEPVASWTVALVTVACAVGLQVLSNLVNDYYDFIRGADKKGRAGFRRALAEGEACASQVRKACILTLAVCVACGLFLVTVGGWVVLLIGVSALVFAWLYSATDHSLSYLGIADIFVFLYYGVIASSGTYFLQTGGFSWEVFYAGAVCGLISMCVLLINNLRDMDADRIVGKRTLPVRFGRNAGLGLMLLVVVLMPAMAYKAFGLALPLLVFLPAIVLFAAVRKAEGSSYNKLLVCAGLINVVYTLLVAL